MSEQKHDEQCERMPNFYLCHCAKRDRLARGVTELPELWVQYPKCGGCYGETWHDGDSLRCDECHVTWAEDAGDGEQAVHFTDDHDWIDSQGVRHTLDEDVKAWRERHSVEGAQS
jgi:hypothetical protein